MIVEVAGLGCVGRRVVDHLRARDDVERVVVRTRRRAVALAQLHGEGAVEVVDVDERRRVDWRAIAVEATERDALLDADRTTPAIVCGGEPGELESWLGRVEAPFVFGAGLAPGYADLLAAHAAADFDEVHEIRVARFGFAGPRCAAALSACMRRPPRVLRDSTIEERSRGAGRELRFFPDPVGGRDTYLVDDGAFVTLRHDHPLVPRISTRVAMSRRQRLAVGIGLGPWRPLGRPGDLASVVAEVIGARHGAVDSTMLGVVDRPDELVAALVVAAGCELVASGAPDVPVSVAGLGSPVALMARLADEGVGIARFDGLAVDGMSA